MSAAATAQRVLEWAAGGSGPPPVGDLLASRELLQPMAGLAQAMRRLCALATARLRWGNPPLNDARPLSATNAMLAAALGATPEQHADAADLLDALPPACSRGDLVLRHAIVEAALPFLPTEPPPAADADAEPTGDAARRHAASPDRPRRYPVRDDWLRASPLTALLNVPPAGQHALLLALAEGLIAHPAGRRWLTLALAEPVAVAAVRRWRQEIFARLSARNDAWKLFVLDCYEANAVHHAPATLAQVRRAHTVITARYAQPDDAQLRDALSVAAWWRPLWELRRSDPGELRRRIHLGYDYLEALELCTLAHQMTGGPP